MACRIDYGCSERATSRAVRRRIDLEGCLNFRDLGGYPTESGRSIGWRRVFRSDSLHHLTARDVARIQSEMGVRVVIDLRSTAERRSDSRRPLVEQPIELHHIPLFDGEQRAEDGGMARRDMTLGERYVGLAEFAKDRIARVIETIARAPGSAVYHCAAGKDRTGVISAILLGIVGVRDDLIAADYAATRESLDAIIERLMATEGYETMFETLPPDTLHADPETILEMLALLRQEHGSIRAYARSAGVSDDVLERLETKLLA
jgi:protein-tyrosine phosphatase